jgi:hypothetical protein
MEKVLKDFRQGEVRIKQVESIPKEAKIVKGGEILAVGKSNNHSHRLTGKSFAVLAVPNGKKYVKVKAVTGLVHEEHKTIKLPKGDYEVQIQREWLPGKEARKVVD